MGIEITFRHTDELGQGTKEFAQGLADALKAEFPPIENVHLTVTKEGAQFYANLSIQGGRGMNAESEDRNADGRTSIGKAFEHAERQLRKHVEKLHDHRV